MEKPMQIMPAGPDGIYMLDQDMQYTYFNRVEFAGVLAILHRDKCHVSTLTFDKAEEFKALWDAIE